MMSISCLTRDHEKFGDLYSTKDNIIEGAYFSNSQPQFYLQHYIVNHLS